MAARALTTSSPFLTGTGGLGQGWKDKRDFLEGTQHLTHTGHWPLVYTGSRGGGGWRGEGGGGGGTGYGRRAGDPQSWPALDCAVLTSVARPALSVCPPRPSWAAPRAAPYLALEAQQTQCCSTRRRRRRWQAPTEQGGRTPGWERSHTLLGNTSRFGGASSGLSPGSASDRT